MTEESDLNRRPIKSRSQKWAQSLASNLLKRGVKPNQVSVASALFAVIGAVCYFISTGGSSICGAVSLLAAALSIQARLVCNLIDGMIAVEGGLRTATGEIFNEFPDRISDSIFLVAAGCASSPQPYSVFLGFTAALVALMTAYIRAFGAAQGLGQDYSGPMAKQQRMFVLTIATLAQAATAFLNLNWNPLIWGLAIIVVGSTITCVRRTNRIAIAMKRRSAGGDK